MAPRAIGIWGVLVLAAGVLLFILAATGPIGEGVLKALGVACIVTGSLGGVCYQVTYAQAQRIAALEQRIAKLEQPNTVELDAGLKPVP